MIKEIFDKLASISGKNDKIAELKKHADNDVLKRAIYLAQSPRVNFYIKQLPEYTSKAELLGRGNHTLISLERAMDSLTPLIKRTVTGNEAKEHLAEILSLLSSDDASVIEKIIGKNCKIGMDSGINKAIPKLIETTPYMGAKSFSDKGAKKLFAKLKKGEVVYSQLKADGTYRNAIIQDGIVALESRQGEPSYFPSNTPFVKQLETLGDGVLNGELTIDGFKRTEANGMINSIMDITEKAEERGPEETAKKKLAFEEKHGSFEEAVANMRYTAWDRISLAEYAQAKSDVPYKQRFDNLQLQLRDLNTRGEWVKVSLITSREITTFGEAMAHFLETQVNDEEGTIIKASDTPWKDGKPTTQIKMKLEMHMDLRIVGFNYGTEGTKNEFVISALQLESECGLLKTCPSGMKEAMMADITERQEELMGTVVEIRCCGLSQNSKGEWSTQHPSIEELRTDKDTCDTLESCQEIERMAKGLEKLIN
jgi:DNA ligase-1|tara:strand:- start:77 stop:1522 length:1446 start_codon:yes stop_codon:yes gene_type:complete